MGGMVTDVKKFVENATTLILTAITLTEHAPPALMDSADQDAIYVCKIKIPFKNNQLLSQCSTINNFRKTSRCN
jgi:hypothetical protein